MNHCTENRSHISPIITIGCLIALMCFVSYIALKPCLDFVSYDLEVFSAVMLILAGYCFKKGLIDE